MKTTQFKIFIIVYYNVVFATFRKRHKYTRFYIKYLHNTYTRVIIYKQNLCRVSLGQRFAPIDIANVRQIFDIPNILAKIFQKKWNFFLIAWKSTTYKRKKFITFFVLCVSYIYKKSKIILFL